MVPRGRRLRRGRPVRAERPAQIRRHRARRLVHHGPAQVAVRAVRLRRPAVPEPVGGPFCAQAGRLLPGRHPRPAGRVEPDRLRLPPDPAGPGPAAVVLAVGVRHRRLHRGHRDGDRAGPADRGGDPDAGPPGTDPRTGARRGAVPPPRLGLRAVRRVGRPAAAGPGGLYPAVGVGGRDGGQVRVPAPAHPDGPGPPDPRPDGVISGQPGDLGGVRDGNFLSEREEAG